MDIDAGKYSIPNTIFDTTEEKITNGRGLNKHYNNPEKDKNI